MPRGLRVRRDIKGALARNGWRDPARGVEYLEPLVWDDNNNSNTNNKNARKNSATTAAAAARTDDEGRGMCDLVDALLHVGYLDTDDKRADVLTNVSWHGALQDVELTLVKIDGGSMTRVHECEILPAAAAGGKGRADVLVFLLDSGLDPNAVSRKHKRTALHVVVCHGDVDMVKVLLEAAGANMVKDDEWGLPIEAAKGFVDKEDVTAKVALIEHWLDRRGLPRDYVDLPVLVDETAPSDKKKFLVP